jgi:hypothetical protein
MKWEFKLLVWWQSVSAATKLIHVEKENLVACVSHLWKTSLTQWKRPPMGRRDRKCGAKPVFLSQVGPPWGTPQARWTSHFFLLGFTNKNGW